MAAEENEVTFSYCLLSEGSAGDENEKRAAVARGEWLESFFLPTQHRKHPSYLLVLESDKTVLNIRKNDESPGVVDEKCEPDWDRLIQKDLKKIHVEDLGDLSARDLWSSIPDEDKDGRGRKDLQRLFPVIEFRNHFLD